jgi:hypothetical protein
VLIAIPRFWRLTARSTSPGASPRPAKGSFALADRRCHCHGIGIWSMHYIGMRAFVLPMPVQYDWPAVLLSLIAAILASAVALFVVSREHMGLQRASIDRHRTRRIRSGSR